MIEFLKNIKIRKIIWNITLIIVGFLFCFFRGAALEVLEEVVSYSLMLYGIFCLFGYLFTPSLVRNSELLIESILFIFAGFILGWKTSLFMIGAGLIILVEGAKLMAYSVDLRQIGEKNWLVDEIIGLAIFILGLAVTILCNTPVAVNIVSLIIGISVIIEGGLSLFLIFALHRNFERVTKTTKTDETDQNDFRDYSIK